MRESKVGSELLKEPTRKFARSRYKVVKAETRELPMDVVGETSASSGRAIAERVVGPSEATVVSSDTAPRKLAAAPWQDSGAVRQGRRWSPRATLAVSGGVAVLLWGLVGLAVSVIR